MHILIVEDEISLAELLQSYLQQAGYSVAIINDGAQVMQALEEQEPRLVLLDIMLPNKDGISLCKEITSSYPNVGIIMTTAKVEEIDRLLGLEIGADDYVCKPYSPREVVARVKAFLRRQNTPPQQQEQETQTLLVLDQERMLATVKGESLDLTLFEFQLLTALSRSPGKVFSRQQLMDLIYDDHRIVSDRTIDSHIKKLRKKVNAVSDVELILSVYGVGYKFQVD